ncbi:DUF7146 domain-containing protein [Sabulicella rubraurantiaca]|uniref:DUF7146 domain-containing protein n=1 Tax=Sabulicella rubraurantiaca TaxID=2811429 RepID=UPI001A962CC5|nr:toprim domain-containing protein [Sabulicella rubraurantiaca]
MRAARDIAARLALHRRPAGRGWAGNCPVCGYANAFSLQEREGRAVWWCASCGEHERDRLTQAVLGRETRPARHHSTAAPPSADVDARTAAAQRLWNAGNRPAKGCVVACYLAGRGLPQPDGDALRVLLDAKHPVGGVHPCMLARVTDATGRGQAIHRTFLAPGGAGKAALDPARMTLGPVGGGVVRLCRWAPGLPLVVGEGIETSLAAGLILGAPAWAALSAGNLPRVPLPPGLTHLLIAADADKAGQRHAWMAADRFAAEGLRVEVLTPDRDDFNDLLQRQQARDGNHG